MDESPLEFVNDGNQEIVGTEIYDQPEEEFIENAMDFEVPTESHFDSEAINISDTGMSSDVVSEEHQDNVAFEQDNSVVEEVYEDMVEEQDQEVVSEEVTEFDVYDAEEQVVSESNEQDQNETEFNVSSELEQSEVSYTTNEEVSFNSEEQQISEYNDVPSPEHGQEFEVSNVDVQSASEEVLNDESAVEVVEEYTENNENQSSDVEYPEEDVPKEDLQQDSEIYHPEKGVAEEQEVESETVEKINQDSENIIDQADTSNDMISSPLDDANVNESRDEDDHQSPNHEPDDANEVDDNDYDDVVEVEEDKQSEDGGDDNVAQHDSGSDNEQDEALEDDKLNQTDNFNVRDSDDDDDDDGDDAATSQAKEDTPYQSTAAKILDSDSEDEGEKEGDLIADIFGKSDDEDEEFTGFGEDESSASKKKSFAAVISDSDESDDNEITDAGKEPAQARDDSSSDEGVRENKSMVYDFDLMLQKKKEERRGRRKKDGGTFISDSDDIINAMLTKMKGAAEGDREANKRKKPALNKLKMLPTVVRHLKKQDLKEAFVDMGSIAAIADWLTILPDRSLPHITIRTELLEILHDLPPIMPETLKSSGIGRAVMMVFKHPRETRKNKESAGRLINKWSRPIFGLNDNFKSMSRGEREQRDLEHMSQSKRRRLSSGKNEAEAGAAAVEPGQLRPGERGFVMRARVPKPSHKDYVVRPQWNTANNDDEDDYPRRKPAKSRKDERLEKHKKTFADRKKNLKLQRAIKISIEGNKMPLS